MKAEIKLLGDSIAALDSIAHIAVVTVGPRQSLKQRQELLLVLIKSEIYRLGVWLTPLEPRNSHILNLNLGVRANEVSSRSLVPVDDMLISSEHCCFVLTCRLG